MLVVSVQTVCRICSVSVSICDAEVSTWGPPTAALVTYALAHAATVATAGSELVSGVGSEPLRVELGTAIVAALAAALVYENALLASGRFLQAVRPGGLWDLIAGASGSCTMCTCMSVAC